MFCIGELFYSIAFPILFFKANWRMEDDFKRPLKKQRRGMVIVCVFFDIQCNMSSAY